MPSPSRSSGSPHPSCGYDTVAELEFELRESHLEAVLLITKQSDISRKKV